jgi:hypothetical protein
MIRYLWSFLALLLFVSGGCSDDFSPPSLVEDFRVLAISAENPEITLSESTTLTALVSPTESVDYTWSACLFNTGPITGFECVSPALECCISKEATATLSLVDLMINCSSDCAEEESDGEEETPAENAETANRFDFDENAIASFTEKGGSILIRLKASHNGKAIEAIKTIQISGEESPAPNLNPTLDALIYTSPSCKTEEACVLEEGVPAAITAGETLEFEASVTENSMEIFTNDESEETESMTYAWYVTNGELISLFSDGTPSKNTYIAPELEEDEDMAAVTLWLIARDGRGGVHWREYSLEVTNPTGDEG